MRRGHFGQHDSIGHHKIQGQCGGGAAGKGAARAMVVRRGDTRQRQPACGLWALQPVHRPMGLVGRITACDAQAGLAAVVHSRHLQAQTLGFALIGRDQRGQGQQQIAVGGQQGFIGQIAATAGTQDRIDHQCQMGVDLAQALHPACHYFHIFGAAQQASFDGSGRQVFGQGSQLRFQHFGRSGLHQLHTLRILCGDGGHHGAEVHA